MAAQMENWDDDADFQGDLFVQSVSTVNTALSSRMSVNSESNAGDEDWQVPLTLNDEKSTSNAIFSAKQAGIPIPANVPSSALLGGSIKKLGKKKSRQKVVDDWGDDLELPGPGGGGLKLKQDVVPMPAPAPASQLLTPASSEDHNDFDDWAEGSLGIRFAGTRRDTRGRSSSVSAMSPSMGSCMTVDSEEDGLEGLVLPDGPFDLNARLRKRKEVEQDTPEQSPTPAARERKAAPIEKLASEDDDFMADIDFGSGELFDARKPALNRNIKINSVRTNTPAPRVATTLTFTDKPAMSRIPRPKPSRLDPVYETGASQLPRQARPAPTTTSAQLLKMKRSAPSLRGQYISSQRPAVPFLPAGVSNTQSHHVTAKHVSSHVRRESDPSRPQSPPARSFSRLSTAAPAETPSRASNRRDLAPPSLARETAPKKTLTRPTKRRNFGDGSELEIFDDLPTSAAKESKFIKAPTNRGPPKPLLRHALSHSKLPLPDRMSTPLPSPSPVPKTPVSIRSENMPRFARDTTASRIAREQRLAGTRPRSDGGPLMPVSTNWKARIAAQNSHASSAAAKAKRRGPGNQPMLIKPLSSPALKNEKGMTYNPVLQRWDGNEAALTPFAGALPDPFGQQPAAAQSRHHHNHHQHRNSYPNNSHDISSHPNAPPSPPRPALISHIATSSQSVRVERGMVFDPRRMCWLKLDPASRDPLSPSTADDEEDPFAGLEDLKDENSAPAPGAGGSIGGGGDGGRASGGLVSGAAGEESRAGGRGKSAGGAAADEWLVGEEFDLGPEFIRRQREEEAVWRRRVEGWVGEERDMLGDGWRWAIREMAPLR